MLLTSLMRSFLLHAALVLAAFAGAIPVHAQLVVPGTDAARPATPPRPTSLHAALQAETDRFADGRMPAPDPRSVFGTERCTRTVTAPDTLALIVPADSGVSILAWERGTGQFRTVRLTASRRDTLRIALTDVRCAAGQALASYPWDLRFFGFTADSIPIAIEGNVFRLDDNWPRSREDAAYVYVTRPGGRFDRALTKKSCVGTGADEICSWAVVAEQDYRTERRRAAASAQASRSAAERKAAAAREATIRAKGWPADVTAMVIARRIDIGMTGAQVRAAWGAPGSINRTRNAYGTLEQWVYRNRTYVYLENGRVRTIQQ